MGSGQVSANITHVFACPTFCCTGPLVESFIHARVSILLRTWSLPTWLAHRASALPPCVWLLNRRVILRSGPVDGSLATSGSTKGQQHPRVCALSLQGSGLLTWPGWTTAAPSMLGAPTAAMPGSR